MGFILAMQSETAVNLQSVAVVFKARCILGEHTICPKGTVGRCRSKWLTFSYPLLYEASLTINFYLKGAGT